MNRSKSFLAAALTSIAVAGVAAGSEVRESLALTYPEGPTLSIELAGTERLPRASGEAKVERKKGMTEIEIELDEMKPAFYFGGDYNTYVLWVVSPEGHTDNLGEFILVGNRSKLNVSTNLETFGMFVTAEPHFLVRSPSRFVVLENVRPRENLGPLKVSRIEYRGFEGIYNHLRDTLRDVPETREKYRPHVRAARSAVELARRAGAERFAAEKLAKARESLKEAEQAIEQGVGGRNLMLLGHRTIRLAVDAQIAAEERAFQAALNAERKTNAEERARLETAIAEARSETERAELLAEQRQMKLEMEQRAREMAAEQARQAAREAAAAKARAVEAEAEKKRALLDADQARSEAEIARRQSRQARERMKQALSQVVEIRDTARGLIINLPDILFDFDRASLRPQAREQLSLVAGVLLVTPGYSLRIEGHTDDIGEAEYNQKLSEERARSVSEYLVDRGLSADLVSSRGFGETRPIVENDSPSNRQQNRRVEIIIEETPQDPITDEAS